MYRDTSTFENHQILLDEYPYARVSDFQSFLVFLHHFVLDKLTTSSIIRGVNCRYINLKVKFEQPRDLLYLPSALVITYIDTHDVCYLFSVI